MSDTSSMSDEWQHAPSVAMQNLDTQEGLFEAIADARVSSGATVEDVAAKLGIDAAHYVEIEAGGADLTLSELRQVAFAIDAVISYSVHTEASSRFNLDFDVIMNYLAVASPSEPIAEDLESLASYKSQRS